MTEQAEEQLTIVVLGATGSGKSALTQRFTHNVFLEDIDPTLEDLYRTTFNVSDVDADSESDNSVSVSIEVFDTAHAEYPFMREQFSRIALASGGFLVLFSLVSRWSFDDVVEHLEWVFRFIRAREDGDESVVLPPPPVFLVGCKYDLIDGVNARVVDRSEAYDLAREFKVKYFECSAKTGYNVNELFGEMVRRARRRKMSLNLLHRNAMTTESKKCCLM